MAKPKKENVSHAMPCHALQVSHAACALCAGLTEYVACAAWGFVGDGTGKREEVDEELELALLEGQARLAGLNSLDAMLKGVCDCVCDCVSICVCL